jgi:hypothetical protein
MKTFATATLVLLFATQVVAQDKKTQPTETFDQKYMAQVEKANVALQKYANTSCTSAEFNKASDNLIKEADALEVLYKGIPDDEDDVLQSKQIEIEIGFVKLALQIADNQSKCVDDAKKLKTS